MKLILSVCALVFLATAAGAEDAGCKLVEAASLDMKVAASGRMYVPMIVAGKPVNMMIDTGAIGSMLTSDTARKLGLNPLKFEYSRIAMFGGKQVEYYVDARDVALGSLKTDVMRFMILPWDGHEDNVNGILGPDVMRNYDIDFDFANAKFNLFSPDHCPGGVVYWTRQPVAVVPTTIDDVDHTELTVTLDGKGLQAIIDTGSWRTVADWETIESLFGIDEKSAGVSTHTEDGGAAFSYPFKALNFGGIAVTNPDIVLIPHGESHTLSVGGPRVIIGISILRQLHFYMANRERKLYISSASAH